ncbi:hypothetical protein RJ639_031677 [Escallonia herrerae]|uniref:Glycosyltransferase n=1 Tax=Escallonia herrerae TaxID=1293975 RepID=A0AA88WYG8_9ASTE|nr:hypothetical protein RJ639_031677 [Escallonia herrerae]
MKTAELVFIPFSAAGHLMPVVESAKLLLKRDHRLSVTVLIMKMPMDTGVTDYTQSLYRDSTDRLKLVELPQADNILELVRLPPFAFLSAFINSQMTQVRSFIADTKNRPGSTPLAGIVIDMLNTAMIDVANEFKLPTYCCILGITSDLESLSDQHGQDVTELSDDNSFDKELSFPSFVNPVPSKVLPSVVLDKEGGSTTQMSMSKRLRETKGIMINTFFELETHALKYLSDDEKTPPVYSVGPVFNVKGGGDGPSTCHSEYSDDPVISWLDDQPHSSVVFLCSGSMGTFDGGQVKEIANALERSGHRFLWSLRRPAAGESQNPEEVFPEGFLERTTGVGKVVGWAPQKEVLSHSAVGGFVSHCGWNSILESVWYGVPMATWPMFGDQQILAFEMVKELEMAVEIKMDYRKEFLSTGTTSMVVTSEEIESGIRRLMDSGSERRKKVKEMKEKSRTAVLEGGSSYASLGRLIEDIMDNIPQPIELSQVAWIDKQGII